MSNSAIQLQPGEAGPAGASAGRNRIINGQFDIWQRDTSFSGTTGLNGDYTADRWNVGGGDDGGTRTMLVERVQFAGDQQDVPFSPRFYAKIQTFSDGGSGSEAGAFVQRIETGPHLFNGQKATASFWARSDTPGPNTIAVGLRQIFGTGGSSSIAFGAQEITLTQTWTFYSLTFDVLSIAGKTVVFGGAQPPSLRLRFFTQVGASVTGVQGVTNPLDFRDELWLTNVQFEFGDTASDYEDRFVHDELALCRRYFTKNQNQETVPDNVNADGTHRHTNLIANQTFRCTFAVSMRVSPSIVIFDAGNGSGFFATFIGEDGFVTNWSATSATGEWNYTADAEME